MSGLLRRWRWAVVSALLGLGLGLGLAGCGGSGSLPEGPPPAPIMAAGRYETPPQYQLPLPDGRVFLVAANVSMDASGYTIGDLELTDWNAQLGALRGVHVTFSGYASVDTASGNFVIPAAAVHLQVRDYQSNFPPPPVDTFARVTGKIVQSSSVTFALPTELLPQFFPYEITAPFVPVASAPLAGIYYQAGPVSEFQLDAAGHLHGYIAPGCDMAGTLTSNGGYVYSGDLTLQGNACAPDSPGVYHFLGSLTSNGFMLQSVIGNKLRVVSGVRIDVPGAAIPDGTASTVPGFTDAIKPNVEPFSGRYIAPATAPATPYVSEMVWLDATGAFLIHARTQDPANPSAPYAEEYVSGTLSGNTAALTSTGTTLLHRDAGSTTWVAGTATVALTVVNDFTGKHVNVTVTGGSVASAGSPLVANPYKTGFAAAPFVVPHGGYFSGHKVVIDSSTGRVHGEFAPGCFVEGVMDVSNPDANIFRMRADISGAGCAAAGVPVGRGDFLGTEFIGATAEVDTTWNFVGVVNGLPASVTFTYARLQ